jgi:hypothetical protein
MTQKRRITLKNKITKKHIHEPGLPAEAAWAINNFEVVALDYEQSTQ